MSTRLDRLIARVVDGSHEIRAPRPAMFEDALAESDESSDDVDAELLAPPANRSASRASAPAAGDSPAVSPRRDVLELMRVEAPRVEQRPAAAELPVNEARRPAPLRAEIRPLRLADVPPAHDSIAAQLSLPRESRRPERTPQHVIPSKPTLRAPMVREHASNGRAPHAQPVPAVEPAAEPDRILIEIGRIDVGGPAPGPQRMLTLDAYRTNRRSGSR